MMQARDTKDGAEGLSKFAPFDVLSDAEREAIASRCSPKRYGRGDIVFEASEGADDLWCIKEGMLLYRQPFPFGDWPAFVFGPGELVGCFGTNCAHRHDGEAVALDDATVFRLPRARYVELIHNRERFARSVNNLQSERLRLWEFVSGAAKLSSAKRVAWLLLDLHERFGDQIPLTRRLLAEAVGVARESTIRALSPLEKAGTLRSRRGKVHVIDPAALRRLLRKA